MPCFWTVPESGVLIAEFLQALDIWTWLTLSWLLVLIVSVGRLQRKLDRIMRHLGLEEELPKPAPNPWENWVSPRLKAFPMHARAWGVEVRRSALRVWAHPRLGPLRRLVQAGITGAVRFIDRLLDRPPTGKSPAQDEV